MDVTILLSYPSVYLLNKIYVSYALVDTSSELCIPKMVIFPPENWMEGIVSSPEPAPWCTLGVKEFP